MKTRNFLKYFAKELLKKGMEGEGYFDLVDDFVRTNDEMLLELYNMRSNKHVVMSGNIAATYLEKGYIVDLVAPSGIRKGNKVNFEEVAAFIKGKTFTFIDDSYYKGRTFKAIQKEIEKYGGTLNEIIVAYDGGYDDGIKSLISYRELCQ